MIVVILLTLGMATGDQGPPEERHPRLEVALARFEAAGLALPEDLEVIYQEHHCDRSMATVRPPWRVTYCMRTIHDTYWEHELAHIWVEAHLTAEDREQFIEAWGLPTWLDDGETPWQWRGTERAAVAIERYVSGYSVIGGSWPWREYAAWLFDRAVRNGSYRCGEATCGHSRLLHRWDPARAVAGPSQHRTEDELMAARRLRRGARIRLSPPRPARPQRPAGSATSSRSRRSAPLRPGRRRR